jgi:3-oxoacyl-[acyl-carrier-protein] synthase II
MANMMRTAVQGIGIVGGFGCGVDQLRQSIFSRESTPQSILLEAESRKLEIPVFLCDTVRLEDFVNKRALRRVDHFSRMALLASLLALDDAGMLQEDHQNLAVVVASGYGATRTTFSFLDSVIDDGDACASPTLFSNSVHNAAAAHISILLKAKGPNVTVSQFEMSVPSALFTACRWLQEKDVDAVIFGGVDEYCNVLGYSWRRFFGQGADVKMRPLELENQSAIAGEGAAFLLLTPDDGDKPKYGYITDIQFGRIGISGPEIAENTLMILGADGHKSAGIHYARQIHPRIQAANYSPLYGSFPTGSAFDIAIAALSIRESKIFATPKNAGDYSGLNIVWEEQGLDSKQISCLKFSCDGEFGMIKIDGE